MTILLMFLAIAGITGISIAMGVKDFNDSLSFQGDEEDDD